MADPRRAPDPTASDAALVAALRGLAPRLRIPDPPDVLADTVLARLDTEPAPARPSTLRRSAAELAVGLRRRWRAATAVAVALLVLLLAVTPAGARIAEWLGLGGVVVVQQSEAPSGAAGSTGPPDTGATGGQREITLAEARAAVAFPLAIPAELGDPERVLVGDDGRVVSMLWTGPNGDAIRLDQFGGETDPFFVKKYFNDIEFSAVGGREALWLVRPHPFVYVDADGIERIETARTAGPTLVWERPPVTFRLEGVPDLDRALVIAESTR